MHVSVAIMLAALAASGIAAPAAEIIAASSPNIPLEMRQQDSVNIRMFSGDDCKGNVEESTTYYSRCLPVTSSKRSIWVTNPNGR